MTYLASASTNQGEAARHALPVHVPIVEAETYAFDCHAREAGIELKQLREAHCDHDAAKAREIDKLHGMYEEEKKHQMLVLMDV